MTLSHEGNTLFKILSEHLQMDNMWILSMVVPCYSECWIRTNYCGYYV